MDRVPLRERNRQRVTQRIMSVASELFKTRGYHPTTMDDIAEKAEISRATLFNYFKSKEALLLPWGQEILEEHIQPQLSSYLSAKPTAVQALQFLFTLMSENIRAFPDVIWAFAWEVSKASDPHHPIPPEFAETGIQEIFMQVLHYGQERGEVGKDIPLQDMAYYLRALQMSLFFRLLETTNPEKASLEISTLMRFIEKGISLETKTRSINK
jgi:AcrR family transcriptional regulator